MSFSTRDNSQRDLCILTLCITLVLLLSKTILKSNKNLNSHAEGHWPRRQNIHMKMKKSFSGTIKKLHIVVLGQKKTFWKMILQEICPLGIYFFSLDCISAFKARTHLYTVTDLANFCVTPLFRCPPGLLSTEFKFGGLVC